MSKRKIFITSKDETLHTLRSYPEFFNITTEQIIEENLYLFKNTDTDLSKQHEICFTENTCIYIPVNNTYDTLSQKLYKKLCKNMNKIRQLMEETPIYVKLNKNPTNKFAFMEYSFRSSHYDFERSYKKSANDEYCFVWRGSKYEHSGLSNKELIKILCINDSEYIKINKSLIKTCYKNPNEWKIVENFTDDMALLCNKTSELLSIISSNITKDKSTDTKSMNDSVVKHKSNPDSDSDSDSDSIFNDDSDYIIYEYNNKDELNKAVKNIVNNEVVTTQAVVNKEVDVVKEVADKKAAAEKEVADKKAAAEKEVADKKAAAEKAKVDKVTAYKKAIQKLIEKRISIADKLVTKTFESLKSPKVFNSISNINNALTESYKSRKSFINRGNELTNIELQHLHSIICLIATLLSRKAEIVDKNGNKQQSYIYFKQAYNSIIKLDDDHISVSVLKKYLKSKLHKIEIEQKQHLNITINTAVVVAQMAATRAVECANMADYSVQNLKRKSDWLSQSCCNHGMPLRCECKKEVIELCKTVQVNRISHSELSCECNICYKWCCSCIKDHTKLRNKRCNYNASCIKFGCWFNHPPHKIKRQKLQTPSCRAQRL